MSVEKAPLRTQDEIIKKWTNYNAPLVSIRCMTYNHVAFIAQCLNGFLMQETDFPFEVVVHDDASSDGTDEVIREFQTRYPKIIKPIFEYENQYSKRDGSLNRIVNAHLQGEYVAICEGDDYWCDSNKLQKSMDFLRQNQDYSACAHNTFFYSMSKIKRNFVRYPKEDRNICLKDALNRDSYHTSSIVCKKEFLINRPKFCFMMPGVGDYPWSIYLTMMGPVKRFGDVMSVYRFGVPGSWQKRVGRDSKLKIKNAENAIKMLTEANEWSGKKYDIEFSNTIQKIEYDLLILNGRIREAKENGYEKYWNSESLLKRVGYYFRFGIKKI